MAPKDGLGPPYILKTPRVLLRCFSPEDAVLRKEAVDSSGAHLAAFFPAGMPLEAHAAQIRHIRSAFDADEQRGYAALSPDGKVLLGEAGLLRRSGVQAFELAYWLRRDAGGQGLATEMAGALLKSVFLHEDTRRVDLLFPPENTRSAAMARRLGFTLEGRLRQRQPAPHHPLGDLISCSLLAQDFPSTVSATLPLEGYDFLGRRTF